jgi:hypothetical protein
MSWWSSPEEDELELKRRVARLEAENQALALRYANGGNGANIIPFAVDRQIGPINGTNSQSHDAADGTKVELSPRSRLHEKD